MHCGYMESPFQMRSLRTSRRSEHISLSGDYAWRPNRGVSQGRFSLDPYARLEFRLRFDGASSSGIANNTQNARTTNTAWLRNQHRCPNVTSQIS